MNITSGNIQFICITTYPGGSITENTYYCMYSVGMYVEVSVDAYNTQFLLHFHMFWVVGEGLYVNPQVMPCEGEIGSWKNRQLTGFTAWKV